MRWDGRVQEAARDRRDGGAGGAGCNGDGQQGHGRRLAVSGEKQRTRRTRVAAAGFHHTTPGKTWALLLCLSIGNLGILMELLLSEPQTHTCPQRSQAPSCHGPKPNMLGSSTQPSPGGDTTPTKPQSPCKSSCSLLWVHISHGSSLRKNPTYV